MTRFTIDEYRQALELRTGRPLEIRVYNERGHEILGLWIGRTEIKQVPAADPPHILAHLPDTLDSTREDYGDRVRIIGALQGGDFEEFAGSVRVFAELLENERPAVAAGTSVLSLQRALRGRIADIVWQATPLLLLQLQCVPRTF